MSEHANKRFALSLPPPEDSEFARMREHVLNTVIQAANELRVKYAIANGVSFWETEATITPDTDRPNVLNLSAGVRVRRP